MDYKIILIAITCAVAVIIVLRFISIYLRESKPKHEFILYFNSKLKRFTERMDENVLGGAQWYVIAKREKAQLHKFLRFMQSEKYRVTTIHQARNVYDIFIEDDI